MEIFSHLYIIMVSALKTFSGCKVGFPPSYKKRLSYCMKLLNCR